MRTYGKSAGCTKITTYNEDKDKKRSRLESDIRDIVGMIKGSSLTDSDKDKMFAVASDLFLSEINFKYMSKVNRYTRAGRDGKIISCPVCGYKKIVYHFGWCAITCTGCKKDIEKTQWNLF